MHKRNESQYKPQVSEHLLHLKKIHQHNENHTETQLLRQQKIKKHLFLTSLQEKMEKLNSCQIPCRSYKKKKSAFKNIKIRSSCKAIHQETQQQEKGFPFGGGVSVSVLSV